MQRISTLIDPQFQLERVVRSLVGDPCANGTDWHPAFDLMETPDSVVLRADLPGIDPEKIEISFHDGVLSVKGEKPAEERPEELRAYRFERRHGSFERAFRLPETVDSERIAAESRHGVLTITLPKLPAVQPKRVTVKVS